MPYFVQKQGEKFCVRKGTKADPGEIVKCHEGDGASAAAVAHMRALYANIEDAEKGGTGSGWHAPPLGTHSDTPSDSPEESPKPSKPPPKQPGDEEDEESDETLHCICPKCGNKVVLPKGVKCQDLECTSCDEQMVVDDPSRRSEQTGEEPPYTPSGRGTMPEKALEPTTNLIHGEGGMLAQSLGPEQAVCPTCGSTVKKGISICPQCGSEMTEAPVEEEKIATEHIGYKSARVTTWKDDSGHYQWLGISSMAIEDREAEVVSIKAYRDAISRAEKSGSRGELDILHLDGTDVGDCTLQHVWGDCLIEGGSWFDNPLAKKAREAVMARPDYWGMSLKFRYDEDQFDGREYKGGIEILKRTILPRDMAASFGTAIAVTGGGQMKMDARARQVLKEDLGLPDEEIEAIALSEKQKALPEPNVVEKTDEKISLLTRVGELLIRFGSAKEVKVEGEKGVEAPVEPVEQEKIETSEVSVEVKGAEVPEKGPEMAITDEVVKTISGQVAESLGTMLGTEIAKVVAPLREKIAALEAQIADASKSVEEKVEERLEELPKIVTVQATKADATKVEGELVRSKTADQQFLSDIMRVVDEHLPKKITV